MSNDRDKVGILLLQEIVKLFPLLLLVIVSSQLLTEDQPCGPRFYLPPEVLFTFPSCNVCSQHQHQPLQVILVTEGIWEELEEDTELSTL